MAMRQKKPALVISFAATADAMAVERYCGETGLPGRLIPIPREITAGCGLAWKTLPEERERFARALEETGIRWEEMRVLELWG